MGFSLVFVVEKGIETKGFATLYHRLGAWAQAGPPEGSTWFSFSSSEHNDLPQCAEFLAPEGHFIYRFSEVRTKLLPQVSGLSTIDRHCFLSELVYCAVLGDAKLIAKLYRSIYIYIYSWRFFRFLMLNLHSGHLGAIGSILNPLKSSWLPR